MQHLDEDLQVLKAAAEMVCDGQHPIEFYTDQLNEQVDAKKHKLKDLELEWYDFYLLFPYIRLEL